MGRHQREDCLSSCDVTVAHKVTRIASPAPDVVGVMAPTPPVAGPSQKDHLALFEDSIMSGDEGVGGSVVGTTSRFPCL